MQTQKITDKKSTLSDAKWSSSKDPTGKYAQDELKGKSNDTQEEETKDASVSFDANPHSNPNPKTIDAVSYAVKLGIPENLARLLVQRDANNANILLTLK